LGRSLDRPRRELLFLHVCQRWTEKLAVHHKAPSGMYYLL
jgi:hypothetical protein